MRPSDLAIRDELPLVIVRDVESWSWLVVIAIAAAVYLGWSLSTDQPFDDLEFIAAGVLVCLPVAALLGSREIRLYRNWLVVIWRGKVLLDRSLDELVALRTIPLCNVHWAVFQGSGRVLLFSNGASWQRVVHAVRSALRRNHAR